MIYDYSKLNGRIKEYFDTQDDFARAIKRSPTSVSYKLNNKRKFTQDEISLSIDVLKIRPEEIPIYFFSKTVEKNSTKIEPKEKEE